MEIVGPKDQYIDDESSLPTYLRPRVGIESDHVARGVDYWERQQVFMDGMKPDFDVLKEEKNWKYACDQQEKVERYIEEFIERRRQEVRDKIWEGYQSLTERKAEAVAEEPSAGIGAEERYADWHVANVAGRGYYGESSRKRKKDGVLPENVLNNIPHGRQGFRREVIPWRRKRAVFFTNLEDDGFDVEGVSFTEFAPTHASVRERAFEKVGHNEGRVDDRVISYRRRSVARTGRLKAAIQLALRGNYF